MARPNKIWFRKDVGWWIVTLGGQKIRLAKGKANRKLAEQKFHELKAVQPKQSENIGITAAEIIDRFLSWSKIHRSSETNRNHVWYGQSFAEKSGYVRAMDNRTW